ncbi:hypothetical protein TNCV_1620681 [Trichonephila clavipes]|nr:hypothetical protein TNCV_1620681 [Trichonephila clavipes]
MFQILLWSPWKYRCGQRTVRMAVVACSQNQGSLRAQAQQIKTRTKTFGHKSREREKGERESRVTHPASSTWFFDRITSIRTDSTSLQHYELLERNLYCGFPRSCKEIKRAYSGALKDDHGFSFPYSVRKDISLRGGIDIIVNVKIRGCVLSSKLL